MLLNQQEPQNAEKNKGKGKRSSEAFSAAAPQISLPKGGGAIRGIGEKFAANPVTGTGSMTIPIATSPGRSGFGPQLSLSYDSGAGNGPFGLGWHLSTPSITRKTDKGLPLYRDAEESDVFILSGAEDLVPVLVCDEKGNWAPESPGQPRKVNSDEYRIDRYRPRIEGLFARIERWTNADPDKPDDVFWRSISKDNVTTFYGKGDDSRISDPADPSRIFSWLISESHDDKGNVIVYGYNKEDGAGIDAAQSNERNRIRTANRYLKSIFYGNRNPYFPDYGRAEPASLPGDDDWMFKLVFDYGEGHYTLLPADSTKAAAEQFQLVDAALDTAATGWSVRNDPFSSYRSGFEVRTYRLCQRVLMFHHFPGEKDVGADCLVRSTDFTYRTHGDPATANVPVYSQIIAVTQSGYKRRNDHYLKRSLPPVAFEYSPPLIDSTVRTVSPESLENLPVGLDGNSYQWVDLDGEGLSGLLSEQGGAWFFKRNLSPLPVLDDAGTELPIEARFGPLELVSPQPAATLAGGHAQFMDLAGDGLPDVVQMSGPVRGFWERTEDADWEPFRAFASWPNVDPHDPNLRFIDLDGDGHADILITEDEVLRWYPSLGEDGFAAAESVRKPFDDEQGPALVFADSTQSVFLADLSGDGLTDIVRIRNGEVCYWPNLGYGRFGAKVTMDQSPWFDAPDLFDPRRIRLADIDGSGTADIIYLHSEGVRLYFNQSGNSWSQSRPLDAFPATDSLAAIQVADLLGNGTACLVWSSPLPGDAGRQMRYVDLMSGQKPHLLVRTINNLGAETRVQYAPSTKFYLADRLAGKPWITKLPFPVHVVERVTVADKWRQTSFSSTYSYHHGYFDGSEREFRGFGRVEQMDVESYGKSVEANAASPYVTADRTLYQPPVKTITWFHTGAAIDRQRILTQFQGEYFPNSLAALPATVNVDDAFEEKPLPEPDLESQNLSAEEWCEALRACKGMTLRQELYELDVDALNPADGTPPRETPVRLFSAATHNCGIRCLQPRGDNPHAVFLVVESEALSYHYELDLRPPAPPAGAPANPPLQPDPRISHTLNLSFDEYGNVQQSVAVGCPRVRQFNDSDLVAVSDLIREVQRERHIAYTETHYTTDAIGPDGDTVPVQYHRLRVPCEVQTYELTGVVPTAGDYFDVVSLRTLELSSRYLPATPSKPVARKLYHELPQDTSPAMRLVEHVRTLFFADDAASADAATRFLKAPLILGTLGRLGLLYQHYKLALTDALLGAIFTGGQLDRRLSTGGGTARDALMDSKTSGYLSGVDVTAEFGLPATGEYWMRSGVAGFAADAAQHFYLPEKYTDAFGHSTTLEYDGYDLLLQSHGDALGNTVTVERFDYRVLAPLEMTDPNDNHSAVAFDALGLPVASAVMGKQGTESGDDVTGFQLDVPVGEVENFLTAAYDQSQPAQWLGNATARSVYDFGMHVATDGTVTYGVRPASACGIVRETHVKAAGVTRIQVGVEYSDGMGTMLVKKAQAEPDPDSPLPNPPLRWIASGKTVLNNKGKPVKKYEPYFSQTEHRFDPTEAESGIGVTPVMYYDAVGRLMRTEMPDGTFSRVEYSPWHFKSFDANDTVLESQWYADRNPLDPTEPLPRDLLTGAFLSTADQRAAWLAAVHSDTPAQTHLDSLGREAIAIAHNRVEDATGMLVFGGHNWRDERYLTFTRFDAEGKPLWVRDARSNLVMQYLWPAKPDHDEPRVSRDFSPTGNPNNDIGPRVPAYDIAGNLLLQHSMDAGDRWMLNDAAGKPMCAWDGRGHAFRTEYDALHRPLRIIVTGADPNEPDRGICVERFIYGEQHPEDVQRNLRGKVFIHLDQAGVVTSDQHDFKGNLLQGTRRLAREYKGVADWKCIETALPADATGKLPLAALDGVLTPLLESETFTSNTTFDALNRPVQLVAPHSDRPGATLNVLQPGYNEAGLLERVDGWLQQPDAPVALLDPGTATQHFVANIDYNAKGQRLLIQHGNGAETRYRYDPETFRLVHLYTRRGASFTNDCGNPVPPPDTLAAPEELPAGRQGGLQNLRYTHDPVGNITDLRDDAQQTIFFAGQKVEPSAAYEYDALYRLLTATGREHVGQNASPQVDEDDSPRMNQPLPTDGTAMRNYCEAYEYDTVGNILAMLHQAGPKGTWTRRYDYEATSNRLRATSLPGDGAGRFSAKYAHDAHGNMLRMPHLPTMEWDFRDQLSATQRQVVNDGPGEKTRYVYDSAGQRVRKVTALATGALKDERIYLGGFEVYREYGPSDGGKTLERETLHVMDDKQRIALVETLTIEDSSLVPHPSSLTRYQFGNHLGSASLELDDQAQIISYEEYHPYGTTSYQAVRAGLETSPKRYRYTGKERDEESGLYYYGKRYYSHWLIRWCSADPLGLQESTSLYDVVRQNPVKFVDLDGQAERPSLLETARQSLVLAAILGIRMAWAQSTTAINPLGMQEALNDKQESERLMSMYNYDRAFEVATGFKDYFDINKEASKIGAPGSQQTVLMIGHATGFNQLTEFFTRETSQGNPLSGLKWAMTGVDGALRLINTVSVVAGATKYGCSKLRGGDVGVSLPALASPPGKINIVSPVYHSSLRDFVVVELPSGIRRAFYRSTGINSGKARAGVWQPTLGEFAEHIFKIGDELKGELWRFGSEEALAASKELEAMKIPKGGISFENAIDLNRALAESSAEVHPIIEATLAEQAAKTGKK
jgi:RHS repeat-associated protein